MGRWHAQVSTALTTISQPGLTAPEERRGNLLPAIVIAVVAFVGGVIAFYSPPAEGEMAVVFPMGTAESAARGLILEAGGRFVAPTQFSNVAVVFAPDPAFAGRVRALGALFTVAARGLCGPDQSQTWES